jgi:hypothetical protein
MNGRGKETVEQQVALHGGLAVGRQHELTPQPRGAGSRGGHPRMIGLDGAGRHNDSSALGERIRDQEFQLARLVPAKSQSGQVIALDQDRRTAPRSAERRAQARRW